MAASKAATKKQSELDSAAKAELDRAAKAGSGPHSTIAPPPSPSKQTSAARQAVGAKEDKKAAADWTSQMEAARRKSELDSAAKAEQDRAAKAGSGPHSHVAPPPSPSEQAATVRQAVGAEEDEKAAADQTSQMKTTELDSTTTPITKGGVGHVLVAPGPAESVISDDETPSIDGYSDTDEEEEEDGSAPSSTGGRSRSASPDGARQRRGHGKDIGTAGSSANPASGRS
jgi:hypothetical protein